MWIAVLTMLMLACTDDAVVEAEPEDISLIDAEAWVLLDPGDDPWGDMPKDAVCSSLGYEVEGTYFEVDTEQCQYGTFAQPALHGVAEGDEMTIVFWHLDLWSLDEGAEGHVAISIGGDVLVEEHIAIPADAKVWPFEFAAPRDIEEGEEIAFHVHNHGYNSWSMGVIEALTIP